jgi:hypothetical protein
MMILQAGWLISPMLFISIRFDHAAHSVFSGRGAGVNLGVAYFRPRPYYQSEKWLGMPKEAILDVFRIYTLVVPLFLVASLWEFLSPL